MIWTKQQIIDALADVLVTFPVDSNEFGKLQFNSQDVVDGDLFVALGGQRDGHDFVHDALNKGAAAAIVSKDIKGLDDSKLIRVTDCFAALELLAKYKRKKSKAKFIGVTGSVGKTSTKQAMSLVLSACGRTFSSRGNFNNYLGVMINLSSMPDDAEYAVIEMGMSEPGQIRRIAEFVRPDLAVITSVAEGHLQFFKSVDEIADAKSEIFDFLDKNAGIAVINMDMGSFQRCLDHIRALDILNICTFGENSDSTCCLKSYEFDSSNNSVNLQYSIKGLNISFAMTFIPRHMAINFASVLAVVESMNLELDQAILALSTFEMQVGRGKVLSVSKGLKHYTIICDYYNANPESMKAALVNFAQITSDKKLAILGDMRELGESAIELHKSVIPYIKTSGATRVLLVGEVMQKLRDFFPKEIKTHFYDNVDELISEVDKFVQDGELLLIKASRGVNLDKVAEYLGVEDAL